MYIVFKSKYGSDEDIIVAEHLTLEEACKRIHGFKKTEELNTGLTHQIIFKRKNSNWLYFIRKF